MTISEYLSSDTVTGGNIFGDTWPQRKQISIDLGSGWQKSNIWPPALYQLG